MKVLITGAAGVLGNAVRELLRGEQDIELRLTDRAPAAAPCEFVQADLTDPDQVSGLCDGVDEVLHVAGIHPWKQYTPQQYIDCNIKGTWNLLDEAARAQVRRVIYTSSIASVGYRVEDAAELPFDETQPCRPDDIYGITKHVGEQFCEAFRHAAGLDYVALRPGCFIPVDEMEETFGFGLLSTRVHCSDVVRAHVLALRSKVRNEAIFITSRSPFQAQDALSLVQDAARVLRSRFPEVARLQEHGIDVAGRTVRIFYSIEKARRLLGYEPQWNFPDWLDKKLAQ